jgi:ketosteroid isomerase-like protein
MQRSAMLGALVFALSALVSAQAPETKKAPPPARAAGQDTEAALMKMERDAAAALTKRDIAGFGSIMAEDAVFTGPDGAVQSKAQLLADVKAGELVIESTNISDLKVRVFGDAAVATYATTDKGKYKGRDISGRYRWTDTFVRRGGKWQVVAGQGTPIQ